VALAAVAALTASLALAPSALADDFYASPAGGGNCTTLADACELSTAVSDATSGSDTVFVRGDLGDYHLASGIDTAAKVTIRGVNGRPRLLFDNTGLFVGFADSVVRDIYMETGGDYALSLVDSQADRVVAKETGGGGVACQMTNSTLTNSLCWSVGDGAEAVELTSPPSDVTDTLRGVTAVATAPNSVAVKVEAFQTHAQTVRLSNVIARGTSNDIEAVGGQNASVSVLADHSNFATTSAGAGVTITGSPTNQTAAPVFVDAAAGNFHQTAASPTVDKGVTHADNGTFDLDGDARALGASTDIGADELIPANQPPPAPVAPIVATGAAAFITDTGANISGVVNPRGSATTYTFEFGTTTAYGASTPAADAGAASGDQSVGAQLNGLIAGTTYHYRLVASNAGGSTAGADRELTTLPTCPRPLTGAANVSGTPLGERILGTTQNDVLNGLAGDDCLYGLDANDRLSGGSGDDTLQGDVAPPVAFLPPAPRRGNDMLDGGTGADLLRGNDGGDRLNGGSGPDRLTGGTGNDRLTGGAGDDRVSGSSGNDRLAGSSGGDAVNGSHGNDTITPGTGRDTVRGDDGNDRISARDNTRDRIDCGGGRDRVTADRADQVSRDCERVSRRR
jgi:Ca2+-binding RTX toxin-like protein